MAILRERVVDNVPISQVCDKHGIQPTLFYLWRKKLFEGGAAVFEQPRAKSPPPQAAEQRGIEILEAMVRCKDEVLPELKGEHLALKRVLGRSEGRLDAARYRRRDRRFREALVGARGAERGAADRRIGLSASKFYDWRTRYGKVNGHNALVPRDHWLEAWEKTATLGFERQRPRGGYRRLTFMMLDQHVVAVIAQGPAGDTGLRNP